MTLSCSISTYSSPDSSLNNYWTEKCCSGETIDSCITTTEKLCRTLEKNEQDKISIFIRELLNELKASILQKPQTWYIIIEAAHLAPQTVAMTSQSKQYIPATSAKAPHMKTHPAHLITLQPESYRSVGNNSQINQMDAIILMTETLRDLCSCVTEFSQVRGSIVDSLAALHTDVQTQRNSYSTSNQSTGNNNKRSVLCQYCNNNRSVLCQYCNNNRSVLCQ